MNLTEVLCPEISPTIREFHVKEVLKNKGDYVNRTDIILIIECDKATLEVSADYKGFINEIVSVGELVRTNDPLAVIGPEKPVEKSIWNYGYFDVAKILLRKLR